MTEKQFQDLVIDMARALGWRVRAQLPRADSVQQELPTQQRSVVGLGDSMIGTDVCDLLIIGEPTTKARVRVVKGGSYTPAKTKQAEAAIRWQLTAASVQPDADHLLRVSARFRSSTKQRRDLDNLVKLVLDACNGFAWQDDVQVTELAATVERGGENADTGLRVTRIGRFTRDCRTCGDVLRGPGWGAGQKKAYCSRACYDEGQRVGVRVACPQCGTAVYRQRSEESTLKFCSLSCSQLYKRGRRNKRWDTGFPTLVLVRDRVVFLELVSDDGEVSHDQAEWISALTAAGGTALIVRPSDIDRIQDALSRRIRSAA